MPEAPLFEFESISLGPEDARRLDGLNAELPDGGLTVIAGPSGSGKSTLLRLCNRLEVPSHGVVRHRDTDVTQRACLARSLATNPRVLLMDEPTSSLDGKATDVLERLARQLVDDGTPVVWVTHSEEQMRRLADHVVLIDHGRVDRAGAAQKVLGDGER